MDSWRAVARKLEEKLEDERGRKTLLDKLAAEIRALNIVVAEKDVLFGGGAGKYPRLLHNYSVLEYCLFAPHRDSGLPLVAHVAHHGAAETFGPRLLSSLSGFGRTLGAEDVEALCDVVGRYAAEERPGVVPATAFPPFLVGPNHQHLLGTRRRPMSGTARAGNLSSRIVERAFKRHGWAMAPATTRNRLGETQLMTFLRQIPPLELLRSFMDHVPGAREAVDEPNNEDGFTPAHLCARLDLADHLQVLLDLGGADVHVKDHKGRTVLDLAETLEATDTLELLAGLEWLIGGPPAGQTKTGMEAAAHGNVDFSRVDLSRFPRIHLPSVPDGVPEKRTGEVLMK